MKCKVCGEREANPKYFKYCTQCRSKRNAHTKNNTCVDCGIPITNKATRCHECAGKARRNRAIRICKECGQEYEAKVSERRVFCSRKCQLEYYKKIWQADGTKLPSYKPGKVQWANGYVMIYDPGREKQNGKNRRIQEHRYVAEHVLGRKLKPSEIVHHINLDKGDNRPCNLLVCSQSYHLWLHSQMALAWAKEHLSDD